MRQNDQAGVYYIFVLQLQRGKRNPRLADRGRKRGYLKEPEDEEDEEDEEIPSDIASSGEEAEAFHGVSRAQKLDTSEEKVVIQVAV